MQIGDTIDFTALNEAGEPVKLSDFRGTPVVLFFYPRANTPGCTVEACEFRDSFPALKKAGVAVLGISRDKPRAQKNFKEKFELPYTLLADPDQTVCKQFDVIRNKTMYGKPVTGIERSTFLFDKDGKLVEEMRKVTPEGHAAEILAKFKK